MKVSARWSVLMHVDKKELVKISELFADRIVIVVEIYKIRLMGKTP